MEIIVLWSDSANLELQAIHEYYSSKASIKGARKIINSIVDKSLMLSANPRMGHIEELLKHREEEIRYLIEGNYKIVYVILEPIILIVSVFDCRQNPNKLSDKFI